MKTIKTIMKVLFASVLLLPFAAQAAPGDCGYWLNVDNGVVKDGLIAQAIDDAYFIGKRADTDESNLIAKLAASGAKVSQNKFSDAIDKLMQISDKATALASAQKAKLDDATGINIAVTDALACVGPLDESVD